MRLHRQYHGITNIPVFLIMPFYIEYIWGEVLTFIHFKDVPNVLIINFYTNNLLQYNKIEKFLIKPDWKKKHLFYQKTVLLVCLVLISVCMMLYSRQYFFKHKDYIINIFYKKFIIRFCFWRETYSFYASKMYQIF